MTTENEQDYERPTDSDPNQKLKEKLVRLVKGLAALALCLLILTVLLGESRAAPFLAVFALFGFLIYAVYVWLEWDVTSAPRKKRSATYVPTPRMIYLSEHTPTSFSYVREKRSETPSSQSGNSAETGKDDPNRVVYQAHWALLVRRTLFPGIFLIVCVLCAMIGIAQRWKLFDYQEIKLLLIAVMLVLAFRVGYAFLDWLNDTYVIDSDSVSDVNQRPFSKKDINVAMMGKIQSVQVRKNGLFQLMLDYGALKILAGESILNFNYVPQPEKVQQLIMERVEEHNRKQKQEEEHKQRDFIENIVNALRQGSEKTDSQQVDLTQTAGSFYGNR